MALVSTTLGFVGTKQCHVLTQVLAPEMVWRVSKLSTDIDHNVARLKTLAYRHTAPDAAGCLQPRRAAAAWHAPARAAAAHVACPPDSSRRLVSPPHGPYTSHRGRIPPHGANGLNDSRNVDNFHATCRRHAECRAVALHRFTIAWGVFLSQRGTSGRELGGAALVRQDRTAQSSQSLEWLWITLWITFCPQ